MDQVNDVLQLPDLHLEAENQVDVLLSLLNLPRSIIASKLEVAAAWRELPNILLTIPVESRNELVARMLIATSVGLFDGAINYIWNAVILNLRERVRRFGLRIISTIKARDFGEKELLEIRDSELLDLCNSLDLLSEEGFFFLSQCREIRNNFSSAHPNIAIVDNYELVSFINRCCKYGLVEDRFVRGVDIAQLISSIKSQRLNEQQIDFLSENLQRTYSEQQYILIPMIYGIYCDSTQQESTRLNILDICGKIIVIFDDRIISELVKQHNDYVLKQDNDKSTFSRDFFFKLKLVGFLTDTEQVSISKKVIQALYNAHNNMFNFYNEPPYAEKLAELSESMSIPSIVKRDYVHSVVICFVGNRYGVSNAALPFYEQMIKRFTSSDIDIMLKLVKEDTLLSYNIQNFRNCRDRYLEALLLVDPKSVATYSISIYEQYMKGKIFSGD